MLVYPENLNSTIARAESIPVEPRTGRRSGIRVTILTLFFLSGTSGLIYQVVWNRMLTLVFGSTVFAMTTVLTTFMAGMALGSFYFGRLIDRRGNPLKVYAYLQAGIGVFALILPFILTGTSVIYIAVHRNLHTSFYILSFVKFLLCFAVIIVPATLMGGTLPVISKFFADRMNRIGWNIGVLYAVNTFGAVLGCFFAGFILIRGLGVSGTIYLAAGINIIVALGALFLARNRSRSVQDDDAGKMPALPDDAGKIPALPEWAGQLALWVIAVSGFCALAYEVLWTRVLTLFLGSTTYAFTTMLTTFLCGIALGSFLMARFIDARKNLLTILGAAQMLIALSAILLIPVFGKLYSIGSSFTKPGWWTFMGSRFTLSFLVMLLPTMLMGATFPLVSKIYTRSLKNLGRSIGNVYSVNTLGSIFGAFLAGFILIPNIGIQKTIVIIACLNAIAGATVTFLASSAAKQTRKALSGEVIALTAIIVCIGIAIVLIDLGKPLTHFSAIFKGPGETNKQLFYREGIDASVTVVEDAQGVRRAFVDANQAAEDSRWDLPSHSVIGHLPILFHPDPSTALVIGFGMGVTSWSISRHGVQVDAVEISPGMVEANKYFTKINHSVLDEPLVNLVVDDGRNYALTTDKKYDMISTGIIHPLVSANSAGFYTIDFYELCKRILTEDGIMCQWVPLHRLPEEHYKMIVRTFKAAFPHTTLWYKYTPDFVILIGTPEKLRIDFRDFKKRMENEAVRADLELVNMADPLALLDSFMMDEDAIDQYVGDGPLHTDNRPRMEFFGTQMGNTTSPNIMGMGKFRRRVFPLLTNIGNSKVEIDDIKDRLQKYSRATEYVISGQLFYVIGDFENAIQQYRMASSKNPQDDNVKWLTSYIEELIGKDEELMENAAIEEYKEIVKAQPNSPTAHSGLAFLYHRRGRTDEAVAEWKTALQLEPGLPDALINLGIIYQKRGMIDEAIEQFEKLLEVQPGLSMIHGMLGDLYREKGDFPRAETEFKTALSIDPEMGLVHHSLTVLYLQQGIKLDEALASAKKSVQFNPAPNFIATLARAYYEKAMYPDAEEEIKRAISMEPENESHRVLLAEIQKKR